MINLSDIKNLEFELTSRCNASCPQCPRQIPEFKPYLDTKQEVTLDDVKKWIPKTVLDNLRKISFKGTFSEPTVARDSLDIVEYLSSNTEALIFLHTNGSLRDRAWWQQLGKSINSRGRCVFAIDGLEDTHSIYRIGTDYNRIIENARTYIESGGAATWQFIAFRHNQHQIDEAKEIARSLGFSNFRLMGSNRFDTEFDLINTKKGDIITKSDLIDSMTLSDYTDRVNRTRQVDCVSKKTGWIVIDWSGEVFPCCYSQIWKRDMLPNSLDSQYWYKRIIKDSQGSNLHHYTLEEIIDKMSRFYEQLNHSMIPKICAKHCSIN